MQHRTRLAVGALAVAVLGTVAATPGRAAAPQGPVWNPPVLVSATQAARETSLVVNPLNPKQQLRCEPSGVPATGNGQSYFHLSADGGRSWKPEQVETAATDPRKAAFEGGDCDVAFDEGGTMYSADTWLGNLSIGHSTDSGESWSGTSVTGTSPVIDRPWLVGGKKGELFVAYQDLQCCTPSAMWFMKSTDFGQTFTPAVPITTGDPDGLYTWEGNLVVGKGGQDLWLVFSRRTQAGVVQLPAVPQTEDIWITRSRDGGATWKQTKVAELPKPTTTIYPSLGLDAGGNLHVVWCAPATNGKGNPVSYTASRDGGATWSPPIELNPGKVGWGPWIVGGKAGEASVAWLGSPDPEATQATVSPWFFSWAKVTLPKAGPAKVRTGNTTKQPIWVGKQTYPEFEMVRVDSRGKMQLGMSVFQKGTGANGRWAAFSQSER